ncbi:hypothetical protein [Haloarcula sp. CBA1127]|uniref:hypothetical protein n=1 Tax=Haloarcula sp. CBA1127 TaxID=1765055 RepID=UPI00073F711F|nr:hypothetical protein [Haloarcula sp. CBA1127]
MTKRSAKRTKRTEKRKDGIQREGVTDPIPEPSYSVGVKKTTAEAIDNAQKPQRFPFEIQPHVITSEPLPVVRHKPGLRETLNIPPITIETGGSFSDETHPEIDPAVPRLRIWESARIQPVTPLHSSLESVEVGLPPRNLMQVEPLEDDRDITSTEVDTPAESVSETEEKQTDSRKEADTSVEGSDEGAGDAGLQTPPDLYDLLFKMPAGSIGMGAPVCIVAGTRKSERYRQTLETLCREQFRQIVGGRPLADLFTPGEAESVEDTRVQNRISSLDDSDSDYFGFVSRLEEEGGITRELIEEKGDADLERLHSRIDEFFTQTLGYLLLFVDEQFAGALYEHLRSTKDVRESVNIRPLRVRDLPDDVKRELVRLAWGDVYLETDQRDLDTLFHAGEEKFKQAIEPDQGVIEEITSHNQGEESHLHYLLKCFVVDFLLRQENLDPAGDHPWDDMRERVQTETEPWAHSEIRPDVYNSKTKEVYEIETLFGSDHRTINRTIEKYEGVNVKRINIIIPNLTCLRNLKTINRKTNEKFGNMFQNEVEFWAIDANHGELFPVRELVRRLVDLNERAEDLA